MQSFEGDVRTPIAAIFFITQSLFILCYFGQRLSSGLLLQSVSIYNSMWYRFPLKVQRYLPMMFMRAQQTFAISGYEIFQLNLYFFVRVNDSRLSLSLSLEYFHASINHFKGAQVFSVGIYGPAKRRRDVNVYSSTHCIHAISSFE